MPAFQLDYFSAEPNGTVTAQVAAGTGTPGYSYSLDGAPFQPMTYLNIGPPAWLITLLNVGVGTHQLRFRDSAAPQAEIAEDFTIEQLSATPSCLYSGSGNDQGTIEVAFDEAAHPDWYTGVVRRDGQPLGSGQTGAERVLVFLANGHYVVTLYDGAGNAMDEKTVSISCGNSFPLSIAGVAPMDASKPTTPDGAATITLTYGVGFGAGNVVETHLGDFNWQAATQVAGSSYAATYTGLLPGPYTVYARVAGGAQTAQYTFTVDFTHVYGCTNPNASNYNENATDNDGSCILPPIVAKPHLSVALMNSLRFVETVDLLTTPPTLDNRLYCSENWQGITRVPYLQKVARKDVVTTQFRSNYVTHLCQVYNMHTGQVQQTLPALLKLQNIGVTQQYPSWLAVHAGYPTKSRLYFSGGALPLAFIVGDRVEVLNAAPASLNAEYTIIDINFDATEGIPYLILNAAFPASGPARINVTTQTQYDVLPYNVYEFTPDFSNYPNGFFFVKITASSAAAGFADASFVSEPFALMPEHPGTNLITWRGYDDALGLNYSTGLISGIRVESEFWQRLPGATRKVYRAPDGKLTKLSSMVQRKVKLSTFWLPPWLHEKLAWAFDLDYFAINGVEHQSEDGYAEPSYVSRYSLSNSSIVLEQVEPFTDQNGTDLGDVNGVGEFIIANDSFLTT